MSAETPNILFMFDCPVHGLENGTFCFRALLAENEDRWKQFELKEVKFNWFTFMEWMRINGFIASERERLIRPHAE